VSSGVEAAIVSHKTFEKFLEEEASEVKFFPLEGNPSAILQSKEFENALFQGSANEQRTVLMNAMKGHTKPNIHLVWKYVQEFQPTGIVSGFMNLGECLAIGQKLLIPVLAACTVPIYPSKHTLPVGVDIEPLPVKWLNLTLSKALWKIQWMLLGKEVNKFRKEVLKLPETDNLGMDAVPLLYMMSEKVVPRLEDTPPHVIYTGYWVLPLREDYTPSPELEAFLNECETPPVYIGFGSMPVQDKQGILNMFSAALKEENLKGIFCGGWANMDNLDFPPNILHVKDVPHEWLFPRCSMVFHHGGAGTTAAGLRAGVPSVILPVLIDQPYWASRVVELGVGANTVCYLAYLSTAHLILSIRRCREESVRKKAAELGDALRQENGCLEACLYTLNYLEERKTPEGLVFEYLPDSYTTVCLDCSSPFKLLLRRHHCMSCGRIFCEKCVRYFDLPNYETFRYCCRACASARNLDFNSAAP